MADDLVAFPGSDRSLEQLAAMAATLEPGKRQASNSYERGPDTRPCHHEVHYGRG